MVAVISKSGTPLMPTSAYRARRILKSGKAVICNYKPYAIRLLNNTSEDIQDINDAYCMGEFQPKHRTKPMYLKKKRLNNRCLEKFYDAKYIDSRDGKVNPVNSYRMEGPTETIKRTARICIHTGKRRNPKSEGPFENSITASNQVTPLFFRVTDKKQKVVIVTVPA